MPIDNCERVPHPVILLYCKIPKPNKVNISLFNTAYLEREKTKVLCSVKKKPWCTRHG